MSIAEWTVPELGTDFSQDFEDIIIQYIYDRWSISNPAKGAVMQVDYESEPDKVSFKPGFPDFFRPYECCCVQTRTTPIEKMGGKFVFTTALEVILRMKRLDRTSVEIDPQMENMEGEVQRIVEHYIPNEIVGIKDLVYDQPSTERIYGARDTYAKSDWRSVIRIRVFYEKTDTSTP